MIDPKDWKWFGNAAHFICGPWCRFHLATLIGDTLVSTVGQYWPEREVRAIRAKTQGVTINGQGDAWDADYMEKFGFMEIGYKRTFETMAFKVKPGKVCTAEECRCGMPEIIPNEIEFAGYDTAGEATQGHMEICMRVAEGQ